MLFLHLPQIQQLWPLSDKHSPPWRCSAVVRGTSGVNDRIKAARERAVGETQSGQSKLHFTSLFFFFFKISAFRKAQARKQKYKCLSKGQFEMIDLQLQRDWKANREIYVWSKDFTLSCLPWGDFHRQLACPAREGVVHRPEAALRMLSDQRRHPERRALLRPAGLILGKKVPPLSVTWPTVYSESIETPSLFFMHTILCGSITALSPRECDATSFATPC